MEHYSVALSPDPRLAPQSPVESELAVGETATAVGEKAMVVGETAPPPQSGPRKYTDLLVYCTVTPSHREQVRLLGVRTTGPAVRSFA